MKISSEISKKFIGTFLLWCFGVLILQVLFSYSPTNSSLVYCPLQQKWVTGSEERVFITKDFDDFCATDKRKEFIKSKIHLKTGFSRILTENLVFDYLEKGNQVFALVNHLPDFPQREIIKKSQSVSAVNNFADVSANAVAKVFTLKQSARPPTFAAPSHFSFQFVRALSEISRNINPRSPPVNLS